MKVCILLLIVLQSLLSECKIIPDYLPSPCPKATKDYEECTRKVLSGWGPNLINGIEEINFPKLNPLEIPVFLVNRTLNENVAINAVLKNAKFDGFNETRLKSFKFDPHEKTGELSLRIPYLRATFDYDVNGNLFSLNISNSGTFKGIAYDIRLLFQFKLKPVVRVGVTYFTFDYFIGKSTIGNGYIKLSPKNPEFQFAANLITNFFNENPKRVLDAVHPIYEESVTAFYGGLAEHILARVPALEILPE